MIPSLFDVEDVTTQPRVRDMIVGPVANSDVEEFAQRYHYTERGGAACWRWGLWHGVTLHGVVAYNLPTRKVCAAVFGEDHLHHVWHMGRLILSDESPRNSESRLIGGSLRAIEVERPDVWAIVTYAATAVGHIGYVYQATNALYTGMGGDNNLYVFLDAEGRPRSSNGVNSGRAAALGWHKSPAIGVKHRYVYILGTRSQRRERLALLKLPVLPYPKAEVAA